MVRVGFGRPGLSQQEDRWGRPVNYWEVSDWHLISQEDWEKFHFYMTPQFTGESATFEKLSTEVKVKMEMSGQKSTLWQFNLPTRQDPNEWRRHVIPMGQDMWCNYGRMQVWSWTDCYIRRPYWMLVCKIKNRLTKREESD